MQESEQFDRGNLEAGGSGKRKPRNTATQPGREGITAVSTDMRAGGFAADTEAKRGFR